MGQKKFDCHRFKIGYLDESGDPGKKGSNSLVLAYTCFDSGKKISKILKKSKEKLRRTKRGDRWLNRKGGELKFTGFPDKGILLETIEKIAKLKVPIKFVAIKKQGQEINPVEKNNILNELIKDVFMSNEDMPHKIIADKDYFNNKKIAHLIISDYEEERYENGDKKSISCNVGLVQREELNEIKDYDMLVSIRHENSRENPELQAIDLIAGAIFQEIEKGDKTYTDIIRKNTDIKGKIIRNK